MLVHLCVQFMLSELVRLRSMQHLLKYYGDFAADLQQSITKLQQPNKLRSVLHPSVASEIHDIQRRLQEDRERWSGSLASTLAEVREKMRTTRTDLQIGTKNFNATMREHYPDLCTRLQGGCDEGDVSLPKGEDVGDVKEQERKKPRAC